MTDYTIEEVVQSLSKINKKSRKRVLVDQRSYLIGLLYWKFKLTEKKISKLTGFNRFTINYNKNLPIKFCLDDSYISNVYVLANQYPFDFVEHADEFEEKKMHRSVTVQLKINKKMYRKLKHAGFVAGHKDIRTTIYELIKKSLKVWEE